MKRNFGKKLGKLEAKCLLKSSFCQNLSYTLFRTYYCWCEIECLADFSPAKKAKKFALASFSAQNFGRLHNASVRLHCVECFQFSNNF